MRTLHCLLALALAGASSSALSQTTMPLNTGYNHTAFQPYPIPSGTTSNIPDNFWIKIASYEPPASSTTVAPGFVLNPVASGAPWAPALTTNLTIPPAASRWIGPRPVTASSPGSSVNNPAYSIFRKCFCLMPGFTNPQLSFQIRGDDNIQVWLNTVTQTLVGPVAGNFQSQPRSGAATPGMFRTGRNCIYVLLEDNFANGHMGFDLAGAVSANGLMPVAGAGVDVSFAPCACNSGPAGAATASAGAATARARAQANDDDDRATIQAIVLLAEQRRKARASIRN
jgi:hypothetical protein